MSAPPRPNISSAIPPSALLSKLQSFLPQIEQENKALENAISAGQANKFNIEVEDNDEEKPVIQMDFALSVMSENEDENNESDNDQEKEIEFKSSSPKKTIHITLPTTKPRPLIQELN